MAINPRIKQKAEDIRSKIFGSEVRESLASGIEAISEDVEATIGRQDYVEEQFQDVLDETTGKDVISAPELIAARNGKSNLKTRLDDEHAEVTAQLAEKAEQSALNVEKARIDSFTTLASGSTTGDAELIDARVGLGGKEYVNVGEHIRIQGQRTNKLIDAQVIPFVEGSNIVLGNVNNGETVNLTPESVTSYSHAIVPCEKGDTFLVTAMGGSNPRTYGFIDKDNKLIGKSPANYEMIEELLSAPSGADRLIINSSNSKLGACYKNVISEDFRKLKKTLEDTILPQEISMTKDSVINMHTGIGNVVPLTPKPTQYFQHALVDCHENDLFFVTGGGGKESRLWGFLSVDNILLKVAEPDELVKEKLLIAPKNSAKLIVNVYYPSENSLFKGLKKIEFLGEIKNDVDFLKSEEKTTEDTNRTYRELEYLNGMLNQMLAESDKSLIVQTPYKYTAWPFISSVGNKLICVYARSLAHEEGISADVYSRISSDGGKSWTAENKIIATPNVRDTITGKGKDANGNMIVWNRVGSPGTQSARHHLYVTTDGINFDLVSEPTFSVVPGHIGDIFTVPTVGLIAFYNTFGTSRSWGVVKSTDNGLTWVQYGVENGITADKCPTEISGAYLQDGKIIAIGRKDTGNGTVAMFQIESSDYGVTWSKNYTNITDIGLSTPSIIYDVTTDLIHLYYFHRGPGILRLRKSTASTVWGNPLNWSASQEIAQGTTNFQDTGNANATVFDGRHVVTYYSGDANNTGIYAKIVTP